MPPIFNQNESIVTGMPRKFYWMKEKHTTAHALLNDYSKYGSSNKTFDFPQNMIGIAETLILLNPYTLPRL